MLNLHPEHTAVATKIGRLNGRNVYRVPVTVVLSNSRNLTDTPVGPFLVTAHSAADAANWVRDHMDNRPETTVRAVGPKGGTVERYIGWFSAMAGELSQPRDPQLGLPL